MRLEIFYSFFEGGHFHVDEMTLNNKLASRGKLEQYSTAYTLREALSNPDVLISDAHAVWEYELANLIEENKSLFIDSTKHSRQSINNNCKTIARLLRNLYRNFVFDFVHTHAQTDDKYIFGVNNREYLPLRLELSQKNSNAYEKELTLHFGDETRLFLVGTDTYTLICELNNLLGQIKNGYVTFEELQKYNLGLNSEQYNNIVNTVIIGLSQNITDKVTNRFNEQLSL